MTGSHCVVTSWDELITGCSEQLRFKSKYAVFSCILVHGLSPKTTINQVEERKYHKENDIFFSYFGYCVNLQFIFRRSNINWHVSKKKKSESNVFATSFPGIKVKRFLKQNISVTGSSATLQFPLYVPDIFIKTDLYLWSYVSRWLGVHEDCIAFCCQQLLSRRLTGNYVHRTHFGWHGKFV